ncbi:NACHT domain-containing protein [Mucilaginibacter sp. ZT4R22]|uniref:NACHT domain-containing protein n=1 Tax=Mucilaginibacter pankratovii TaxID=2772110 RepID=A0ABR7WU00_9SPHI|nr:NACHT domain-containing protein [Mucilaginibacter pankratovii]MBD1365789.1 NACHT domain-containing protein [Mucilaginibacter pankratovii]
MTKFRNIEILEKDNNKKGDLFGRLMSDVFHSLGYDEPRLNIHQSGREIDIQAFHRTENKVAIAECKATKETIGGSDINKFIGVLDAEKKKIKKSKLHKSFSPIGYFASLSGFKETAIEQELGFDNTRLILLGPEKIVDELIHGRVVVPIEKAISAIPIRKENLELFPNLDLFAYEKGWVWVIYYSENRGQTCSHFAFVHADGRPLIDQLSSELISLDRNNNGLLNGLQRVLQPEGVASTNTSMEETKQKYYKYLENECGEIQFEGLPTDKEAGSVKVKLESIFVPIQLAQIKDITGNATESENQLSIGSILSNNQKVAILAKPGGGKSTLIKRIAIAYAFPERRPYIDDDLPNYNWFPIFIRCRELGEQVNNGIIDIIQNIPIRAEINDCRNPFSIIVSHALQNGTALLLIDGLDEISEDRNRISFVNQLRTFIATYPQINIIVTSREAGFRAVAGILVKYCEKYKVCNLAEIEIKELTLKWHKAIIDDSNNTIHEAIKIANLIVNDSRIKVLAENPLLLTTLLFVRRWAGYLPTKRTVLYQEMIKLLLVTWNVEGHDQLDIEEAEPQLAFIAYWMTKNGQQTITDEQLKNCLIECRKQMPEILGYTKISPADFIKRVESRSSLLILSGHQRDQQGCLLQIYEFLHLSFQEYLTAKAIVKKYLPSSDSYKNKIDIIRPNLNNQYWKEVIPITAVLLERDSKDLIELLIDEAKKLVFANEQEKVLGFNLLGNCIANEIQIGPQLLDEAIEWHAKSVGHSGTEITEVILNSKFNDPFRAKIIQLFFEKYDEHYAINLASIISEFFLYDNNLKEGDIQLELKKQLLNEDKHVNCMGILGVMTISWEIVTRGLDRKKFKPDRDIFEKLISFLKTDDKHYVLSTCWAIAWMGEAGFILDEFRDELFKLIFPKWIDSTPLSINSMATWALGFILTPDINIDLMLKYPKVKDIINERFLKSADNSSEVTSLYLGILAKVEWSQKDILTKLKKIKSSQALSKKTSKSFELFVNYVNTNLNDTDQSTINFDRFLE